QRTGGYIYDATVLRLLNETGCATKHLELSASFPEPSPSDMTAAFETLAAVPETQPVLIDGLALGAMDPARVAKLSAPIIALVHHPLGLETGLSAERAAYLIQNETEVLKHVAHVIVTSNHVAETLVSKFEVGAERISVAQPGFPRVTAARAPASPPLILSVGLLAPRKGHDVLIDALARIADLPWQAKIVGRFQDPDFTSTLRTQIAEARLDERIELAGELAPDALQEAYQTASIFALATRYEGYGIVLGEAMTHGLPIVSCRVGAVPETVGKAAILVPPDDPQAFADALCTLLKNPDAAARASLAQAAHLPTWQDTVHRIAGVIDRVTAQNSKIERYVT
ncbi:MAG: glycosyltransferase family 4 protein, partial [Pseudomonadota bacterium]